MRAPIVIAFTLSIGAALATSAQLPNASAAATGLSGAYTARARGYDAVAWNPANLGFANNPDFSIGALAFHGSSGLDPISLGDFAPFSGKILPASQREAWLETVAAKGGQNGRVDGGITLLALNSGRLGVQISGAVAGSTKLNADAFEAIMFGNAGRTGAAKELNLGGSSFRAGAFTTAGVSYGFAFGNARSRDQLAFGLTGKYIIGNALTLAVDQGSAFTQDSLSVRFPMVHGDGACIGSGVGLDAGLAWTSRRVSFGVTVQNAFNTFAWDESKLRATSGTAVFDGTNNQSDFDGKPFAEAPAALRARVTDDKFKPIVAIGMAYELSRVLTFSADVRQQVGDALLLGPKTSAAAGLEYRGFSVLSLRGGASYISDGWGVSGGIGVDLGGVAELGVGAAMRMVNSAREPVLTLNLLSFR